MSKILPFNKKNAKLFGESLYKEKDGIITLVKLCCGELKNGMDGKKRLHCALGEAHNTFINKKLDIKKLRNELKKIENKKTFDDTYVGTLTDLVAKKLSEAAVLKSEKSRDKLLIELKGLVEENDVCISVFSRTKNIQEYWLKKIVPLLK